MPSLPRQMLSYIVIGLLQLAFDSLAFITLTLIGLSPLLANPLARASAAGLGFALNGAITFAHGGQRHLGWRRFLRFALVWSALTALGTVLLAYADHAAGLHMAWIAKPFVELLLATLSFTLLRQWVFRPSAPHSQDRQSPA